MARAIISLKNYSFVYDFSVDGGSVGTKNMAAFLPQNAVIFFGFAKVVTTLTGGVGTTIGVGITGGTDYLINDVAIASWTANAIIPGFDLLRDPRTAVGAQLTMTINVAPVTTGTFVYNCTYLEFGQAIQPNPGGIGYWYIDIDNIVQ